MVEATDSGAGAAPAPAPAPVDTPASGQPAAPAASGAQTAFGASEIERILAGRLTQPAVQPDGKEGTEQQAEPAATEPPVDAQKPEETTPEPQIPDELKEAADLVNKFGGAESLRQFSAIYEALSQPDPRSAATALSQALSTLAEPVQNEFIHGVVDANRDYFLKYLQQGSEPEKPADAPATIEPLKLDFDLNDYQGEPIHGAFQQLQQQVQQLQQQLAARPAVEQQQQQQGQQDEGAQKVEALRAEVFGATVNKAFENLNWADNDVRDAFDYAVLQFNRDPQAVRLYEQATAFAQGDQRFPSAPMQVQQRFAEYLKTGIERQSRVIAPAAAAPPPPPVRREIPESASSRAPETGIAPQPLDGTDDPDAIAARITARLERARAQMSTLRR